MRCLEQELRRFAIECRGTPKCIRGVLKMSDVAALPDSSVARFEVADRHLRKAIGLNSLLRVDRRHHRIGLDFPTVAAASAAGPAGRWGGPTSARLCRAGDRGGRGDLLSGRFPQAGLVSTAEFGQRRISPT